ncbi:MAG: hypothetical protein QUV05_04150 [Phycisphaerae bacterium]|nr:hypothetical protein [Phycisphaerae bacterium]
MLFDPLDTIQYVINDLIRLRDELESYNTALPPYTCAIPAWATRDDAKVNTRPSYAVAKSLTQDRDQLHDWLLVSVAPEVSRRAREVLCAVETGYRSFGHHFGLCLRRDAQQEDRQKLVDVHDACHEAVETAIRFYVNLRTHIQAAIEQATKEVAGSGDSALQADTGAAGATIASPQPATTNDSDNTRTPRVELPPEQQYIFRRDGNVWEVRFGDEHGHFRDLKGLGILAVLLARPNPQEPIPAIDLMGGDSRQVIVEYPRDKQMDDSAMKKSYDRLREIEEELEEANNSGNVQKAATLTAEKENIIEIVKHATGKGFKMRPLGPAPATENARTAVRRALTRAYREMKKADPPMTGLVAYLHDHIQTNGTGYLYKADSPLPWLLLRDSEL